MLDDAAESEILPAVCEEYLETLLYDGPEFGAVVNKALNAYQKLKEKGEDVSQEKIEHLKSLNDALANRSVRLRKVMDDAEKGIWDEAARGNIKGFDLIDDKIFIEQR